MDSNNIPQEQPQPQHTPESVFQAAHRLVMERNNIRWHSQWRLKHSGLEPSAAEWTEERLYSRYHQQLLDPLIDALEAAIKAETGNHDQELARLLGQEEA